MKRLINVRIKAKQQQKRTTSVNIATIRSCLH